MESDSKLMDPKVVSAGFQLSFTTGFEPQTNPEGKDSYHAFMFELVALDRSFSLFKRLNLDFVLLFDIDLVSFHCNGN